MRLSVELDAIGPANDARCPPPPALEAWFMESHAPDLPQRMQIIGITDAGDQGLIALKACQAYVIAKIQ